MGTPVLALLLWWQAGAPVPAVPEHLKPAAELVAAGKFAEAQQALAGLDAQAAGVRHLRGVIHFNLRQYPQAVEELTAAVQSERPGSPAYGESALLIGQSHYLRAQVKEAIPWLEKAREAGGAAIEVPYMLGNAYVQTRQREKAAGAFAAMFGVEPGSAGALLLTAQMMVRQEFEEDAIALLRQALEKDARLPGAHQILGELATYRGDVETAVTELTAELALNPNSWNAYYKLGDAHSRREEWDRAIPNLQKSIWLNPNYSGPYILLGKGYLKLRQLPNAEGMLRRALQLDPQNTSGHYLLGQVLVQSGRAEEGKRMMQRSRELRK